MRPALLCLGLASCGGVMMAPSNPNIAFAADFEGYESWPSISLPATDGGSPHSADARTVFINHRAPAGSTEFPVGTLIVKEMPFHTFAMGKRAGSYNANGARGWEWFELTRSTIGTLAIKWRGLGPPLGEEYGKSGATCNDCHKAATQNDSVMTPGLGL